MRWLRGQRIISADWGRCRLGCEEAGIGENCRQADHAEAAADLAEHLATGQTVGTQGKIHSNLRQFFVFSGGSQNRAVLRTAAKRYLMAPQSTYKNSLALSNT